MNQRGTILMVSIWILAILMLLTVSLAYRTRMEIRLSSLSVKKIKAHEMARQGIREVAGLLKNDTNVYDSLNENWALSHGEPPIQYSILDEERKINLNTSPWEVISAISFLEEASPSIIDWRDEDDISLPGGAEDIYYISLASPYHCKNKSMETMEELLAIKGITPEVIRGVKPLVTVYGHGKVNINTASLDVLTALFAGLAYPPTLADKIILYSQGLDGIPGTGDDNVFEALGTIKTKLSSYGLTPEEEEAIDSLITNNRIDVISSCYLVTLKAVYEGKYYSNIEAILFKDSGIIKIIYWRENA